MPHLHLVLSQQQRQQLLAIASRPTSHQRTVERSLILDAADGQSVRAIAKSLRLARNTVRKWIRRFTVRGISGLEDQHRSGRPRRITPDERCRPIATACQEPADHGLAGHSTWSASLWPPYSPDLDSWPRSAPAACNGYYTWRRSSPTAAAIGSRRSTPEFEAKMHPVIDLYHRRLPGPRPRSHDIREQQFCYRDRRHRGAASIQGDEPQLQLDERPSHRGLQARVRRAHPPRQPVADAGTPTARRGRRDLPWQHPALGRARVVHPPGGGISGRSLPACRCQRRRRRLDHRSTTLGR